MYTIEDYRNFRNRWAMLALAPLVIGVALIYIGLEYWNRQTSDALETMSVDWKLGFIGFVANAAGFGFIGLMFWCLCFAWANHKTMNCMEVRGRLNRRHAHPCKHERTSRSRSL